MKLVELAVEHLWRPFIAAVRSTYDKQSYPLGYAPGLDGLRGVMTLGVLAAHTRHALAPGAILYMDIFFVMSGYFITALLLRDWERHGRIRFGNFYARRFMRLVPPFAAMIAAYLLFGYFFMPDFRSIAIDAAAAFGYVMNLVRAGLLPSIPPADPSYLGHTWSLAIEEQFYLVWPVVLIVLLRRMDISWRLFWTILGFAAAVWAWRIYLTWQGESSFRLYNGTDTRADALMIGCALAVWLRLVSLDRQPRLDAAIRRAAWPLLIGFAFFTVFFYHPEHRFYYYAGSVLLGAVPAFLMIVILVRPTKTVLHRVFEQPPLLFLGRIFYAMYLWHLPVFAIMNWHYGLRSGMRALIGFPLVFALAVLSYVLIERHFMRSGQRLRKAPAQGMA